MKEYEYLIVSDLHLASLVCQHDKFEHVIKNVVAQNVVLNGDIIDVNHTQKLSKKDWHVLTSLRKLSKHSKCYWNAGNHDADVSKMLSEFMGYEYQHELKLEINDRKIIITHGDQFDSFIGDHPLLTTIGAGLYYWLQALDPKQQTIPRFLKQRSKNFIKAGKRVKANAIKWAKSKDHHAIICSHVHQAELIKEDDITYANTGCFTYADCYYVTIDKLGKIELHTV